MSWFRDGDTSVKLTPVKFTRIGGMVVSEVLITAAGGNIRFKVSDSAQVNNMDGDVIPDGTSIYLSGLEAVQQFLAIKNAGEIGDCKLQVHYTYKQAQ